MARVWRSSSATTAAAQGLGREGAGRVARVHAGLLDVLHHPADDHLAGGVAHGVDVDLDRVLEEPVDQHRPLGRSPRPRGRASRPRRTWPRPPRTSRRRRRRSPWPGRRARSTGGPAPGSRSAPATAERLGGVGRRAARGLGDAERGRTGRSSARGPRPGRSTPGEVPSTSSGGSRPASLSGVWPPEATMTPDQPSRPGRALLGVEHVGHVLVGERLEVEAVGGVVVGRDRLGVAVDHHRLEAGVAQGERGVHAAVVELDALADAVGARAEDDHPRPVRRAGPRPRPRRSSSGTGVWASNSAPQVSTVLKVTPHARGRAGPPGCRAVGRSPNR